MKKVTKFFMAALLAGMCNFGYGQTTYEWKKPPKSTEVEIGIISLECDGGYKCYVKKDGSLARNEERFRTDEQLYEMLLNSAKNKYGETYPKLSLRSFVTNRTSVSKKNVSDKYYFEEYTIHFSAIVVVPDPIVEANENLSQAIDKAFRNVRQGSRIAIDQVTVWSGLNREDYKDQVIDILLDKGYKVVAKEYLERLYEEQQNQQSGIYNERTTVQENNFSAVGYFINVKVTETSLRVQVVNVSTGEYEGNATVNF